MSFEIKIKDACTLSSDKTITAREALALSNFPKKEAVVACRVNREQRPLSWELVMDSYIEFITTDSIEGIEVYTRTLAFLLTAAATRVLGVRLHLTQSMLYSYFYESPERLLLVILQIVTIKKRRVKKASAMVQNPNEAKKHDKAERKHVQKKKGQNRKSALGEDGTCSGGGLRNLNREFRAVSSGAERARQRVTGTLSARNLPT